MVTVSNNQSLFDIAIQVYGSVKYAFDLALANGLSITSDLAPGDQLEVPELETDHLDIRDYYAANGIRPATAITADQLPQEGDCNYCKLFE
ncbi:MAG: LysM domain-containing protein [Christiangramia sp.]|uniref:LysM peptidoglycan-binding domain-containing protein n=1 Tax=Christiangramia sp. TaxID=1931228 RepID=UPI003242CEEA